MSHPWNSHLRLGIVHPQIFPAIAAGEGPVLETARQVLETGIFSALEISWIREGGTRERLKRLLTEYDVDIAYCAVPPIFLNRANLCATDELERERSVAIVKTWADQAVEMGARLFTVVSGPDPGPALRDAATESLVKSLAELCSYAAERTTSPMTVTLECFDRDVDKKCLIGPTAEARAIAQRVTSLYPNFGLTVDMGHLPLMGESPEEALQEAGKYLVHVHLGNCILKRGHPAFGDTHPRIGVPGGVNGPEALHEFLVCLKEAGFLAGGRPERGVLPIVSFEVKPMTGETPADVMADTVNVWTQTWRSFLIAEASP